jgi:hypothetical protein
MRFCVFNALCKSFGACLMRDDGPSPAARVHNNQIFDVNGEDHGGDNSEGDSKGSNGGRGYEDDGNDDSSNGGGDGGDGAKRQTMTPNGDKHNNQILSQHQRQGTWW